MLTRVVSVATLLRLVVARGLLLLYRPKDISNDCVFSHHLRYDLSFGNGLSDTITLVFRTLNKIDYQCSVEIVTDVSDEIYLLVVIRFPNNIGDNCPVNGDAFTVMKKDKCLRICDVIGDRDLNSPFFIISVRSRIRFKFLSNSSINTDMDANLYQVTATSARKKPIKGCDRKNETICAIKGDQYCFTSGVVCDGIKNCGITDWFDERKSECEMPVERIGHAPVVALAAVALCLGLAAAHLLARCLPPRANSFFIFNENEDNRLCIDTVFAPPDYAPCDIDRAKRVSVIPVSTSSSEEEKSKNGSESANAMQDITLPEEIELVTEDNTAKETKDTKEEVKHFGRRKTTMRAVTELLHERLASVRGRRSVPQPYVP